MGVQRHIVRPTQHNQHKKQIMDAIYAWMTAQKIIAEKGPGYEQALQRQEVLTRDDKPDPS